MPNSVPSGTSETIKVAPSLCRRLATSGSISAIINWFKDVKKWWTGFSKLFPQLLKLDTERVLPTPAKATTYEKRPPFWPRGNLDSSVQTPGQRWRAGEVPGVFHGFGAQGQGTWWIISRERGMFLTLIGKSKGYICYLRVLWQNVLGKQWNLLIGTTEKRRNTTDHQPFMVNCEW